MARPTHAPRLHRLPQRLDYTLIPAPLDLSLSQASEKSPLPAIIVTPSSPCSDADFCIAFLAPPPKPSLCERLAVYGEKLQPLHLKARWAVIIVILFFIMACHVLAHRFAMTRPHFQFDAALDSHQTFETGVHANHHDVGHSYGWLDLQWLWDADSVSDVKREFVITEDADAESTDVGSANSGVTETE